MAEFRVALGATADLVSGDEHRAGISDLKRYMGEQLRGKPKPILRPLSAADTFTLASGGTGQLILGRPAAGRVWVVTRNNIVGADDHTTVANVVAGLYIGDEQSPGLVNCVRFAQAVPQFVNFNQHAMIVHDRETLFVQITATGSVTGQVIVANATAWEYSDAEFEPQVI